MICWRQQRESCSEENRTTDYSSWERGTNEVTNKMVRRKVPKGTNFDDRTAEDIQEVENWINKYPRRIHGCKSAAEMFEEELQRIS